MLNLTQYDPHMTSSQKFDQKSTQIGITNYEHSPDSDLFKKYCNVLTKLNYNNTEKTLQDPEVMKALSYMKECTKKTKYQLKVLDLHMIQKVFIPLMYMKGNVDTNILCAKIFLNIARNKNNHYKLIPEEIIMKELLNLLIIYLNSNLTTYIIKILLSLTENNDYLNRIRKINDDLKEIHILQLDSNNKDIRNLKTVDIAGFTRVFAEKILDDLSSFNKNLLLKTIQNIYTFNPYFMNTESIEPIMRCLGDKETETTISALKIILLYAKDKNFHQQLINTNFIFRLVRIYKLGILEIDVILVQILLIFFENKTLHDLLFESKIVLILENYLNSFDNDQKEEVLRNVFEIFKEIIKIPEKDGKGSHRQNKNPIKEDPKLQMKIFTKALGLATNTKKDKSILSCVSTINLMLSEYSDNLLIEEEHIKKIIELMPNFFKSKDLEILKYSLSIFDTVLSKKQEYFLENYVKSNDKTFSIKSLVHSAINLINEFFSNYEVLKKSCNILIQLSDISLLHNFFLQEPQITIIRVFNDDLVMDKIKLVKEIERLEIKKVLIKKRKQSNQKDSLNLFGNIFNKNINRKDSFSSMENGTSVKYKNKNQKNQKNQKRQFKEEKEFDMLKEYEKRLIDNKEILKSSIQIVANLTRYTENLELLTKKGFLEIIDKMLISHNLDALPHIVKCIQGFCGSRNSIETILNYQMMQKILKLFKMLKDKEFIFEEKKDNNLSTAMTFAKTKEEEIIYEKIAAKLEVLICLRNIVESDIKLQRQFILDEGIQILLSEVQDKSNKLSDKSIDQLNAMILKVIYVISCNINKLFIVFNKGELEMEDFLGLSEDSDVSSADEKDSFNFIPEESSRLDSEFKNYNSAGRKTILSQEDKSNDHILVFKKQLSQNIFMEKLLTIGSFEITSIGTYKELIKILINLYLNRYYLKYFTHDNIFEKVMSILENILNKYLKKSESNYDIIKLILIFLKFICEEENLIKRFLESKIISNILSIINTNEFAEIVNKSELGEFYYNTSLVLLRLTEFKGHTERLDFIKNLFIILENLYDINFANGKIYIVNILKNILTEKSDFFNDDEIVRFINKIVINSSSFIIYEFVELMKVLVHNRNITKRMENVFKYLINEIRSQSYSLKFKKKILEIILCLSYENSNIKDFALQDLLILVKSLDININNKTTLMILMNFSSVSSNFSYLQMNNENRFFKKPEVIHNEENMLDHMEGVTINKKDLINIVNHLLDSDRFSQILIQKLLINITSIDNIDLSIISEKILNLLIEIIFMNKQMQESIIIFSLSILINMTNRNILKMELHKDSFDSEDNKSVNSSILKKYNNDHNNLENQNNSMNSNDTIVNLKDIHIVDYILNKLPNIISIFNDLFNRDNIDIDSLTVMLACNLSRKIILSSFFEKQILITKCIEDFFINKFDKFVLESESGKFLIIAIIKYCISLSGDERKVKSFRKLFEHVFNIFINQNKINIIPINKEDIATTSLCFILVESQLKFMNIILEVYNNLNLFDVYDLILNFYFKFIEEFSNLFSVDSYYKINREYSHTDFNLDLQEMLIAIFKILVNFKNNENKINNNNFNYEKISQFIFQIILNIITYEPSTFTEDLKSLFIYIIFTLVNSGSDKNDLNSILDLKKWLIDVFKLPHNHLQTDYYCLKLFTKSIQNGKLSDIFWESKKFIRKLSIYLIKADFEDEKSQIMKRESEKIFNIISFNQSSHNKLHELGIYNYFKTNLFIRFSPGQNEHITKDDVIFLVNFILNNENHEFIKDDITSLLKNIFLCKDLVDEVKIHLFDIFVSYTLEKQMIKIFKEDYLIIFNLLYDNLRENFSDMIFLVDNFTKKYHNFAKQLSSDDKIIKKIFSDFLNFDKNFPSRYEELNSFFKILEIFIHNNITETILEIIQNLFKIISNNKIALSDVNIINTVIGFFLFCFVKICEFKNLVEKNDNEIILSEIVTKFYFNDLINNVLIISIENKELANIYILVTMILQNEYKYILKPLKLLNNFLFGKEFLISFFKDLIKLENLNIKEFVYIIHLAVNLLSYGSIECLEDFLLQLINIYNNFLLKVGNDFNDMEMNDIISSLYFFCDLLKNSFISHELFYKILKFIINVLTTIQITNEQKEILIKYYHEILIIFKITNKDDLNLIFTFFLKIHYDKTLNFIENLIIETIINNTIKEIILNNLDSFIQMLDLIISKDLDEYKILQYFKFIKMILLKIKLTTIGSNKESLNFIKELKNYFMINLKKMDKEIRSFEDLKKKREKILAMF